MIDIEYPKIETLYNRDLKTHKVIPGELRMKEFELIRRWFVTEKVDGTNVRVTLHADGSVEYGGRTGSAQMPLTLVEHLRQTLTPEVLIPAFEPGSEVILFGEGYGEKIQNGGGYRKGVSFRLFDVRVGPWWLEPEAILDVATKIGVQTVPAVATNLQMLPACAEDLEFVLGSRKSLVSTIEGGQGCNAEGIVARSQPLLFTRKGERVMWKLKFKDF